LRYLFPNLEGVPALLALAAVCLVKPEQQAEGLKRTARKVLVFLDDLQDVDPGHVWKVEVVGDFHTWDVEVVFEVHGG